MKIIYTKMKGDINLTGIDFSEKMIKRAQKKYSQNGIKFGLMNLNQTLHFCDNCFDGIFSCHVIYNLADPLYTLKELARVLKPGGNLVIATPQTNNPSNVFVEHLRLVWQGKEYLNFFQTIFLLPVFALLVLYNILLSLQSNISQDHFFKKEELVDLLEKAGFENIQIKTAYADVDILAFAQKKKGRTS